MKLWLDDIRTPPENEGEWKWAKSVREAQFLCYHYRFEIMSLDHDLGDYADEGGDGIAFVNWLCKVGRNEKTDCWPDAIFIHSGNPVGRDNMLHAIDKFGPYDEGYGNFRRMKE